MCTQHNTYHRACSKSLLCSPMPCSPAVEPICLRPNSVVFKCLPRLLNGNCVLKTRRHTCGESVTVRLVYKQSGLQFVRD